MISIIICLFALISINVFCENKKNNKFHSVEELRVVNTNLFPILDSIVQTNYYAQLSKIYYIELNLDKVKTDLIDVRTYMDVMLPDSNLLGYFSYKNRTFFVNGDSINITLFEKTNKFHFFDFSLPIDTVYIKRGTNSENL